METKQYTCIVCPMSCRISVQVDANGDLQITGNTCQRGQAFARNEYLHPQRMLTSTVRVEAGALRRLPVISASELPKEKLLECLQQLYKTSVKAPVKCGDIIIKNICGTGVDIYAARDMPAHF